MKSIKFYLGIILFLLAVSCLSLGLYRTTKVEATSTNPTNFAVLDGAQARLVSNANGQYGLRFTANVGASGAVDGATYKMMIVPSDLVSTWKASGSEKNVVNFIKDYAGDNALAEKTCTPDANGNLRMALTDIKWVNLNRKFTAVTYYEKDGNITVADLAGDGDRSIADVANKLKTLGLVTDANDVAVLDGYIADGALSKSQTIISSQFEPEFICGLDGAVSVCSADTELGTAWKITVASQNVGDLELEFNDDLILERISGYETLSFSVFNPSSDDGTLYLKTSLNTKSDNDLSFELVSNGWTNVTVFASRLSDYGYMLLPKATVGDYYVTDVKAYKASENGAKVSTSIDALNSASELKAFDGFKICTVINDYASLSVKAQSYVTNYDKVERLKTVYDRDYKIINDLSDISGFNTTGGFGSSVPTKRENKVGYDINYGKYMTFGTTSSVGNVHLQLDYPKTDLEAKLADCEKVIFYIYNPNESNKVLFNDIKTSGASYDASTYTLKAKSWTELKFTKTQFLGGSYIGVKNGAKGDWEFKVSAIYAETYLKSATPVIDLISVLDVTDANAVLTARKAYDTLSTEAKALVHNYSTLTAGEISALNTLIDSLNKPSADLTFLDGVKIDTATKMYHGLSEESKLQITNHELLENIKQAFDSKFYIINDMSDTDGFTYGELYDVDFPTVPLTVGYDSLVGNYISFGISEPIGSEVNFYINYPKPSGLGNALADYATVVFYIYNPSDSVKYFFTNALTYGSVANELIYLNSGWNEITMSVEQFLAGTYVGLMFEGNFSQTYRISTIYAVRAT